MTSEILLLAHLNQLRALHGHFKSLHYSPFLAHAHPSSCFKRTEKRVLQQQLKLVPYGNAMVILLRPSNLTFYLILVSDFHFAVAGISHVTASPARVKV